MSEDGEFARMRERTQAIRAEAHRICAEAERLAHRALDSQRALAEAMSSLQDTRIAVRSALGLPPLDHGTPDASDPLMKALAAAGLDEGDIDDLADGMIAAYKAAVARDDDEMQAVLGGALRHIGHHLARGLGPRAAGIILS